MSAGGQEAGTVRETMLYCMAEDPPTGQPTFTGLLQHDGIHELRWEET